MRPGMSVTGTMDPSNYELVNKFDAERAASRAARDRHGFSSS
jgi:hypothetical protein